MLDPSKLASKLSLQGKMKLAINIENLDDEHGAQFSMKSVSSKDSLAHESLRTKDSVLKKRSTMRFKHGNLGNQTKRFIVVKKTFVDKDGVIIGDNKMVNRKKQRSPDLDLHHLSSD